jgi:DNA-binding PadR family transcriptional regulator
MAFYGRSGIRTSKGKLSPVHLLVLATLKRGPAHGYMILQQLSESLEGWELKSGTLYPALHRIESLGLIKGKVVKLEGETDTVVEYGLTADGKFALHEAFHGLRREMQIQNSVWHFLSDSFDEDVASSLFDWTVQERNPMGYMMMKRHCNGTCHCSQNHLEYLKKYREYLHQELDWIDEQLDNLKGSKKQ